MLRAEGADIRHPPLPLGSPPAPGSCGDSPPPTAQRTEPSCVHLSHRDHTVGGRQAGRGAELPPHTTRPQALSMPKAAIRETEGGQPSPPSHRTHPDPPLGQGQSSRMGGRGCRPKGRPTAAGALITAQGTRAGPLTQEALPRWGSGRSLVIPILQVGKLRLRGCTDLPVWAGSCDWIVSHLAALCPGAGGEKPQRGCVGSAVGEGLQQRLGTPRTQGGPGSCEGG